MRKIFCLLLAILLCASFAPAAHAAGTITYSLDDMDMSLALPADLTVFTRDNLDERDTNLKALGYTKEDFLSYMTSNSLYLDACDEDVSHEITVVMQEADFDDLRSLNDSGFSSFTESFAQGLTSTGADYVKSEIYENSGAKYFKIYIEGSSAASDYYALNCFTVVGGRGFVISYLSYAGEITADDETALKDIVDSAVFGVSQQAAGTEAVPAGAFLYTDSDTGLSFLVPANWSEKVVPKKRDFLCAKFALNADPSIIITYGSSDLWNNLTASEQAGIERSDYKFPILRESDVASMFDLPASGVSTVTYNGTYCFKFLTVTQDAWNGLTISLKTTNVISSCDGYLYLFQFSGTEQSKYYADFEALLNRVVYPLPDTVPAASALPSGGTAYSDVPMLPSGGFSFGNLVFSLIVTIVVYSLPIIIYRYGVRKKPVAPRKARVITIVYAVISLCVMTVLVSALGGSGAAGGGLFLWTFVNYKMLTGDMIRPVHSPRTALPAISGTAMLRRMPGHPARLTNTAKRRVKPRANTQNPPCLMRLSPKSISATNAEAICRQTVYTAINAARRCRTRRTINPHERSRRT